MVERVKNFLFNLCKKKTILFVFFFSFFGLTFAKSVYASWVLDIIFGIPSRAILLIFWVFARLAVKIVQLAGFILNWVLSPGFTRLSYTNPANNEIIKTGLGVTQGFVNMLLVLILVYIAIATILRLAGYETKKLLITFIIVALLVNFAPVICGLIVDASNIVMNFFIQDLGTKAFAQKMGAQVNNLLSGFDWMSLEVDTALPRVFQIVIMTGFLLVLAFILSLFSIIFILRYLVIWLLVILSPLAFACYILPITRKYFDKWWEQFINWSFIGVSCGFFLYLGLLLVTKIPNSIPAPQTGETPIFNNILPYFVSAIFLGIGLVFGLQTSAIGASTVVNFAKARGRGTLRGAGIGAKWVGGRIAQRGIRPVLEKARLKELTGRIAGVVEKVPVARWFLPEKARLYGQMRPAVEKATAQAKSYSSRTLANRLFFKADTQTDALGNLIEILERNDGQDIFDGGKRKFGASFEKKHGRKMTDDDLLEHKEFIKTLTRPLQLAASAGMLGGATLRKDPRLAKVAFDAKIGSYGDRTKIKSSKEAIAKAVNESRSQHIAKWEPEVLENKDVIEAALGQFDRERWLQISRTIKTGQNFALKGIDKSFKAFLDSKEKYKGIKDPEKLKVIFEGDFKDHIKEKTGGEGYFKALGDKRIQDTGWRAGRLPEKSPTTQTPTAGAAAMGSPPPSPIPSTGGQGKKEIQGRRPGGLMPDRKKPPKGRRI